MNPLPRLRELHVLLACLLFVASAGVRSARAQVNVGDIVTTNFGLQNRFQWTNDNGQVFTPSNTTVRLHDFAGKIVFFVFFDVWCGKCQAGVSQTSPGIRQWFDGYRGNSNGIPVAYVVANKERAAVYQSQTDVFLRSNNVAVCGNDYTATTHHEIRNYFVPTNSTPNGDPRPVFLAINCVADSTSHPQWQLILKDFYNGGGAIDFSAQIAAWRQTLDSVQAPPPQPTNLMVLSNAFQFTFQGQRGRTNRVECTTNFTDWTVVTNAYGTNAPLIYRDTNTPAGPKRYYKVRRL